MTEYIGFVEFVRWSEEDRVLPVYTAGRAVPRLAPVIQSSTASDSVALEVARHRFGVFRSTCDGSRDVRRTDTRYFDVRTVEYS